MLMKTINLQSLLTAYKTLNSELCDNFLNLYCISIARQGNNDGLKPHEIECLQAFVQKISSISKENAIRVLDNFFVGYKIPQIGKEFDLLKISDNSVINIELKVSSEKVNLKKQLCKNKYYLTFLRKKTVLFAFVKYEDSLYRLNDNAVLEKVEFTDIYKSLRGMQGNEIDIDKMFNPSEYLISPFNSTDRFMEEEYFLTEQQEEIKNSIFKFLNTNKAEFIAINGQAGTGKTLLAYDIAKNAIDLGKRVLIIHCAQLNIGQHKLINTYSWNIIMAKDICKQDFSNYDVIIIDETQRMYPIQYNFIVQKVKELNLICIFSYDEKQFLSRKEQNWHIPERIEKEITYPLFKLTTKIRINKEIASFIKQLFNNKNNNKDIKYSSVNICYCKDRTEARSYMLMLQYNGWKVPKYTPGTRSCFSYENYVLQDEESVHAVIGQEFDNIVAVIDENFIYDKDGHLTVKEANGEYYSQAQMLYQILTRVRKKLHIVIISNVILLERCVKILR